MCVGMSLPGGQHPHKTTECEQLGRAFNPKWEIQEKEKNSVCESDHKHSNLSFPSSKPWTAHMEYELKKQGRQVKYQLFFPVN